MRLDISNDDTVEKLDSNIVEDAIREDSPVDICRVCYNLGKFTDDVEHPPYDAYDDGDYCCAICGASLDEYVDG